MSEALLMEALELTPLMSDILLFLRLEQSDDGIDLLTEGGIKDIGGAVINRSLY